MLRVVDMSHLLGGYSEYAEAQNYLLMIYHEWPVQTRAPPLVFSMLRRLSHGSHYNSTFQRNPFWCHQDAAIVQGHDVCWRLCDSRWSSSTHSWFVNVLIQKDSQNLFPCIGATWFFVYRAATNWEAQSNSKPNMDMKGNYDIASIEVYNVCEFFWVLKP